MAALDFPVNHPLAVKLWSKKIAREALKSTHAAKFMGESSNSLIQVFDDTSKGAGDRIRWPLRVQLSGRGVTGTQVLEGNEELMNFYYDDFIIDEMDHAVRSKVRIDQQRVQFSIREEMKDAIVDWYAGRIDQWMANVLTGYTAETDVIYTGQNATTAPTTVTGNSRWYINDLGTGHTAETSLSSSDTFSLALIDRAVNIAKTATPLIRPIKVGSQEYFVCFVHPNQVKSLRSGSAAAGSWFDIQKAAMTGGEIEDNPIFTGALGVYNGVVLHEWSRLPAFACNDGTAEAGRRAVFCGAQSAAFAWGKGYSDAPKYVEDYFDYERQFGVSVQTIAGAKKSVFNSNDFGTIVISTYAPNP
jgi:N4-gp56 family major capsid protein